MILTRPEKSAEMTALVYALREAASQAFPNGDAVEGMTLRDYFAGQAMIAISLTWSGRIGDIDREALHRSSEISYAFADAMLSTPPPQETAK